MSRILRRPMFRGGRVESKGDLKVVDQMGIAKLANGGMAQRPGYGYGDLVMKEYESIKEKIPMPERQPMSTGDYLRIASAGADILAAPSEGSGIFGALRSAAPSLSKLGTDLGTSIDAREAKAIAERNNKVNAVTEGALQMRIAEMKNKGDKEIVAGFLNNYWDPLIAAEEDADLKADLERQKAKAVYETIVLGKDISDEYKILSNAAAFNEATNLADDELGNTINPTTGAKWLDTDPGYSKAKQKLISFYLAELSRSFQPELKADGGRVGKANGGMMTEDVNMMTQTPEGTTDVNVEETVDMNQGPQGPQETNEINISYDQLRDRLPPEVSDDIVLLLSQSYEALADFAELQTQADVNEFNIKYDVQLYLPQQQGA